jgi:hypothetical protein
MLCLVRLILTRKQLVPLASDSIPTGLPASNASFIKEKAVMFHKDMYGDGTVDGAPSEFKCSTGKFENRAQNMMMHLKTLLASMFHAHVTNFTNSI